MQQPTVWHPPQPVAPTRPRRRGLRSELGQIVAALAAIVAAVTAVDAANSRHGGTVWERLDARRPPAVAATAPVQQLLTRVPASQLTTAELAARQERRGYKLSPDLATTISAAAEKHGIPVDVAFGLVRTESAFRNGATSPVGAIGLGQLMPRTARWMRRGTTMADLRDPARNLDISFAYLRTLVRQYDGDMELALLAYNRGPGTVDRILRRGGDPDNGYAAKVMDG